MGDGVVANVVLNKTKGNNGGWIVIAFGWAMAVFLGVYVSTSLGGSGHLNPAVTIAMVVFDNFDSTLLPTYILAQFGGAITGAIIVWLAYKQHFDATENAGAKLAVFCTGPAIRNPLHNLITEIIGTFVFIVGVLHLIKPEYSLGSIGALPVAFIVFGVGLSLGGPTGYAINPARDLGPRIMHAILPIKNKGTNDWQHSWIPIAGPIIGGVLAAFLFK